MRLILVSINSDLNSYRSGEPRLPLGRLIHSLGLRAYTSHPPFFDYSNKDDPEREFLFAMTEKSLEASSLWGSNGRSSIPPNCQILNKDTSLPASTWTSCRKKRLIWATALRLKICFVDIVPILKHYTG